MMRAVLLGLIGLMVSLIAVSVTLVVQTFGSAEVVAEAVTESTDSIAPGAEELLALAGVGGADSVAGTLAGASAENPAKTSENTAGSTNSQPAQTQDPELVAAAAAPASELAGDTAQAGSERLARIFGAMKPADAARVLEKLDDVEVRMILQHLADRKAAAIIGHFDAARAASLSRSVMGPSNLRS